MIVFLKSGEFDAWLAGMNDHIGKAQIALRLDRAAKGNFGGCEPGAEGFPKGEFITALATVCILPGETR